MSENWNDTKKSTTKKNHTAVAPAKKDFTNAPICGAICCGIYVPIIRLNPSSHFNVTIVTWDSITNVIYAFIGLSIEPATELSNVPNVISNFLVSVHPNVSQSIY